MSNKNIRGCIWLHPRNFAILWFFTESWGKSSLGARLRTRKVRGRDASLPAPLLVTSLGLVGRGTVGALPQTPQGTLSLDPARGRRKGTKSPPCPLCAIELVALSCSFRVQLFGASPKHLFAPPTFHEEPNLGMARHSSRTIITCICRSNAGITHSAKPPSNATSRITSTSMPSMSNTALLNARV